MMAVTVAPDRRPGIPRRAGAGNLRPNTAPAYYLGHLAHVWIAVMRPRVSAQMIQFGRPRNGQPID